MNGNQAKTLFYRHIQERISGARKAADALVSGTKHKGIAGQIREVALRDCLQPFLPHGYLCGSGVVIDSLGNSSDQIDAVIYDRRLVPEILVSGELAYFPVESVRYIFEIKSRLTAHEIRDARKKFDSMRRLIAFPSPSRPKGENLPSAVLFAFGSDIKGSEIERFRKYNQGLHVPCTCICVLGKGYWIQGSDGKWAGHSRGPGDPDALEFCQLITGVMNTLVSKSLEFRPFSPGTYVGNFPDLDYTER